MANVKNKPLTSIVMVSYDVNQLSRQITLLALEAICKYTDEEDYELILVDTIPEGASKLQWFDSHSVLQMGEREDRIWIKQDLKTMKNPGTYASYNNGARVAKGDYLCFIQNDVIVTEGWLTNMKYYLDNKVSGMVMPDQFPRPREFVKQMAQADFDSKEAKQGRREAGMVMMTREVFDVIGGWPEGMIVFYGEKHLYDKLEKNGIGWTCTSKTMVLHVNSGTYWARDVDDRENLTNDVTISGDVHARLDGRL